MSKMKLDVIDVKEVKKELNQPDPNTVRVAPGDEKELDAQATSYVDQLLNFTPEAMAEKEERKEAVESMGAELQKRAAKQSELLRQPIKNMAGKSGEGSEVANALVALKVNVEDLDPGKFDLEPGWFTRTIGRLPGVGSPLKRYFTKYESAQTVVGAVIRSLENGRDQLMRDNVTLIEDQKAMRESSIKLEKAIRLGQMIDQKLEYKLSREVTAEDPRHAFIQEELVFPLRQRIIDLQQQLAVNQQGVLAAEIIIRNNKELSRGVNRALNVTVTALEVGATVAIALANQKIVMDKVDTVSKATSDLIAGTASRLKTQGVQIQKQASSATLNMDSLKNAFADISIAMDDLANFRRNALPQMASQILELDKMSKEAEKAVKKLDEGNKSKPTIQIDVE